MTGKAIAKINAEMQKDPANQYMEIVGHYVIDRCGDEAVAAKVLDAQKTLKGAMAAVWEQARKAQRRNVAVLLPGQVFGAVDRYFGLPADSQAQLAAMGTVAGAPSAPAVPPEPAPQVDVDLMSFF